MLFKIIAKRLAQLVARLTLLQANHKKFHATCFSSNDKSGRYYDIQRTQQEFFDKCKASGKYDDSINDIYELDDYPQGWNESDEHKYLDKSKRIIYRVQKEILAINYFNAINNSGYVFRMTQSIDNVNKYDSLGLGHKVKVESDNLWTI